MWLTTCAGPLNYNPVEEHFFHRIKAGRPIPVPGSGMQVRLCQRAHRSSGGKRKQQRPGEEWAAMPPQPLQQQQQQQSGRSKRRQCSTASPAHPLAWTSLLSLLPVRRRR